MPKARAPFDHSLYAASSVQWGIMPQWVNCLRFTHPRAPRRFAYSPFSSLETTAIGMPPSARVIWIAIEPSPPVPQTRTTSFGRTVCGAQLVSMR